MMNTMTTSEYVDWIAYFNVDWNTWKPDQAPATIQDNLALSLTAIKAGKKKKQNAA